MQSESSNAFLEEHKSAQILLHPVMKTGKTYFVALLLMVLVLMFAAYAYLNQFVNGLIVTGLRDKVSWGVYITNFVFFIGISHAGTFISAVLRVTDAQWRHPITRIGELLTAFGLFIGAAMVLIDIGRIDRILYVLTIGKFNSPILWDFLALSMYIVGSLVYLYIALIPDFALMRDHLSTDAFWLKRWMWRFLAVGWQGTEAQHKRLNRGIGFMAWILIPVMITVHTVVSYTVGGVMLRPGWRSTIFGPYFVIGALYSGTAALITAMFVIRVIYPEYKKILTERHFRNMGVIMVVLSLGYAYFTFSEYIGALYSTPTEEAELLNALFYGDYALLFWFSIVGGIVIPGNIFFFTRARSITGIFIASILVNIGMWIKRFVIIVPAMARPWIAGPWGTYIPTWVEAAITLGAFTALVFGIAIALKFFPIAPLWEILEDEKNRKLWKEADLKYPTSFADQTFPLSEVQKQEEENIASELILGKKEKIKDERPPEFSFEDRD
ncbi:MAG: NrfD/PsrC family molybdoenzyme membrane anchor subunit [Candidatus Thorarchaeota archaeon]